MLSNFRIAIRLWIPVIILTLNVVIVGGLGANALWDSLMSERINKVRALTEVASSTLEHFYRLEQNGTLTRDQAQQAARAAIRDMRYEGTDYIYVVDQQGIMLVHGQKPALEGQSQIGLTDPNGVKLIQGVIEKAQNGGGFVQYAWAKSAGETPSEKLAYGALYSPWGWVVATGVYMDDLQASFISNITLFAVVSLILMSFAGVVAVVVAGSITKPLSALTRTMAAIAKGDLAAVINGAERRDEVGHMARALAVFRDTAAERVRLEQQHADHEAQQEHLRRQAMLDMADHFENKVGSMVHMLSDTAHSMQSLAEGLEQSTADANVLCGTIDGASTEASTSVEAVAGASEELASSMGEISRRLREANTIAAKAVDNADAANQMVGRLNDSADQIGRVVGLITDIASQTNLLALNATIESARAGDAGKGFAVVANEVKTLANQTSKATEEISQQIADIQTQTRGSVQAIQGISDIIGRINAIATDIAAAVEQQGAATQEIARNVYEAAQSSGEVSRGVTGVGQAVHEADQSARDVARSADGVARIAADLRSEMGTMLSQIRA